MSDQDQTSDDAGEPVLPPGLLRELEQLSGQGVRIPASMDAAILGRAKAEFTRRSRWRPVIRWGAAVGTIAATLAVVFVLRGVLVHPPRHLAKGDLDGDGKVDMLDAYILAKRVAAGGRTEPVWDVNGDGVVDQQDVDWIASHAVSIGPAGGAPGGAGQ